jgi:hypothetical protein
MLEKILDLISNVIKNNQLLTLLLGVLFVWMSAVDEFKVQDFSFNLNDSYGRLGLAAIGTLLIFWSLDLLPTKKKSAEKQNEENFTYGVKIAGNDNFEVSSFKAAPGENFNTAEIKVKGLVETEIPSGKSVWLFHVYHGREILYFPQSQVVFSSNRKSWSGSVLVGKTHSQNSKVMVAVVGDSGKILCDYYWLVKDEANRYVALRKLSLDIIQCDSRDIRVV